MVLWLDLANTFGSMPHNLVQETLVRALVRNFSLDYYSDFSLRVPSVSTTSQWHSLEVGIVTGCPISVILFALAMNRGPKSKSGIYQSPISVYMDALTVTTHFVIGCGWVLKGLGGWWDRPECHSRQQNHDPWC